MRLSAALALRLSQLASRSLSVSCLTWQRVPCSEQEMWDFPQAQQAGVERSKACRKLDFSFWFSDCQTGRVVLS